MRRTAAPTSSSRTTSCPPSAWPSTSPCCGRAASWSLVRPRSCSTRTTCSSGSSSRGLRGVLWAWSRGLLGRPAVVTGRRNGECRGDREHSQAHRRSLEDRDERRERRDERAEAEREPAPRADEGAGRHPGGRREQGHRQPLDPWDERVASHDARRSGDDALAGPRRPSGRANRDGGALRYRISALLEDVRLERRDPDPNEHEPECQYTGRRQERPTARLSGCGRSKGGSAPKVVAGAAGAVALPPATALHGTDLVVRTGERLAFRAARGGLRADARVARACAEGFLSVNVVAREALVSRACANPDRVALPRRELQRILDADREVQEPARVAGVVVEVRVRARRECGRPAHALPLRPEPLFLIRADRMLSRARVVGVDQLEIVLVTVVEPPAALEGRLVLVAVAIHVADRLAREGERLRDATRREVADGADVGVHEAIARRELLGG